MVLVWGLFYFYAMTRHYLLVTVLILWSVSACKRSDSAPVVNSELNGNWSGDYQTQQAGSCSWTGPATTTTATFQVVNNTVTATITQIAGPTSIPAQYTGTLKSGLISISKSNSAVCNGTSRTYTNRFDGTISGNTLTLISRDTVCPVQGCIFLRTMKLTRQ